MNNLSTIICGLVASVAIAPCASATTFNFSATQTSDTIFEGGVADSIVDEAMAFSNLSGTIEIDETTKRASTTLPNAAEYDFPAISLDQFALSGLFSNSSVAAFAVNDEMTFLGATLDAILTTTPGIAGLAPGVYQTWTFFLQDFSATALGSTDLPATIDVNDWDAGALIFEAFEIGTSGDVVASETVRFTFDSSVTAVPVPASMPLALAGFALLWGASRRPRKSSS